MADYMSETAPGAEQSNHLQSTPSGPKRNNRNRKNTQQPQMDGAMSDGALVNPALSPRPRKARQRQSVATAPAQQHLEVMGQGNAQRARPVSYAGGRVPATPAKEQAYAGPTFQASPAASSLPMPKFSKSVPNAGMRGSLSARLAAEKKSDGEQSSPETDVVAPAPPPREVLNSPLDLFFKADREEKARSGSGSLSPQMSRKSQPPAREPFGPKSIFLNDANGDMDMPSPRTVPTNNERPPMIHRAASSPGAPQHVVDQSEEERRASTQKLKNMLFSTATRPTHTPNSSQLRTPPGSGIPNANFNSPSPFNRPGTDARHNYGPSTPQPIYEQQEQENPSLHYGNKNLSPLFQASRSEMPARPSSLRQEMASDTSSNADSGVAFGDHPYSPNTHARNYLHQTARAAGPFEMPQFSFNNNHPSSFHGPSNGSSTQPVNAHHSAPTQAANTSSNAPRGNDLRDMSAELRRMLKI